MKHLSVLLFLTLLIISCSTSEESPPNSDTSSPPTISSINIITNDNIAGEDYSISAVVSDTDNDIESYNWTVSEGSYDVISNANILWHSPNANGTYTISLTVTDSENNSVTKSQNISLSVQLETFQKFVPADYYRLYSESQTVFINGYIYLFSSEADGSNSTRYSLNKIDLNGDVISSSTFDNYNYPRSILGMHKTPDDKLLVRTTDNIIKMNTNGEEEWRYPDHALTRFIEMDNGNYFFTGSKEISAVSHASYTILTPNGVLIEDGLIDESYGVRSLNNVVEGPEANTYFTLGWVNTSSFPHALSKVLHINSSGEVLSSFEFPYNSRFTGRLFRENDGSYTAFFNTRVDLDNRIDRINIDSSGNIINQTSYSFNNDYTKGFDFEPLNSGGYIITGAMGDNQSDAKSLIYSIDASGEILWQIDYGAQSDLMDFASSCLELEDGKIIVTGSSLLNPNTNSAAIKVYIHKYRSDGSL